MYEAFFELSRRPFSSTPDTSNFYPVPEHEEALALLKCCVNEGEGIGVLIGPPGSGKTLLCHMLLDALSSAFSSVLLTNMHDQSVTALLQAILYDLGLPYEGKSEQELRLALSDHLIARFSEGSRTLIFVDEAQNLSIDQIEELRLLTNLEGRHEKAVQVLLFGQSSLTDKLEDVRMEAFRQRVSVVAALGPLDAEQAVEYIRALIANAGGSADSIFTANALCEICERSEGLPRRINQLCHRSLLLAFAHESGTVDSPYVEAAAAQLYFHGERHVSAWAEREAHHSASSLHVPEEEPSFGAYDEPAVEEVPSVVEVGAGLSAKMAVEDRHFTADIPARSAQTTGKPRQYGSVSKMRQMYNRSA